MEIYAMITLAILVTLSAVVQHINTVLNKGPAFALTDRSQPLSPQGFSGRSARTLQNNLESAAMMLPLLLAVQLTGLSTMVTTTAALTYLLARIGFTLSYWLGLYLPRSLCWVIGLVAIVAMATNLLMQLVHR